MKKSIIRIYGPVDGRKCKVRYGFKEVSGIISHRETNHLVIKVDNITIKVDPARVIEIEGSNEPPPPIAHAIF